MDDSVEKEADKDTDDDDGLEISPSPVDKLEEKYPNLEHLE